MIYRGNFIRSKYHHFTPKIADQSNSYWIQCFKKVLRENSRNSNLKIATSPQNVISLFSTFSILIFCSKAFDICFEVSDICFIGSSFFRVRPWGLGGTPGILKVSFDFCSKGFDNCFEESDICFIRSSFSRDGPLGLWGTLGILKVFFWFLSVQTELVDKCVWGQFMKSRQCWVIYPLVPPSRPTYHLLISPVSALSVR